jgi:hypothetical protein
MGKVRQATFLFKSSSRSVLRPDTALMLECVPSSKSNDTNKSAPVVFLFIKSGATRQRTETLRLACRLLTEVRGGGGRRAEGVGRKWIP